VRLTKSCSESAARHHVAAASAGGNEISVADAIEMCGNAEGQWPMANQLEKLISKMKAKS
jgi:hypothetical protein